MSSFGPPGARSAHPSLPPRPPPSTAGSGSAAYASTVSSAPSGGPSASNYDPSAGSSASNYYGPSAGSQQHQQQQQQHQPRLGYSRTFASASGGNGGGYNSYNGYSQQQQSTGYGPQAGPSGYGAQYGPAAAAPVAAAPPQIRNPFPVPNPDGTTYEEDQQRAAQMATWQGAYMPKENSGATNYNSYYNAAAQAAYAPEAGEGNTTGNTTATTTSHRQERKTTVYRSGGGKTWADDSLLEWDPSHLRLFVGNLAGEVTDETLLKAFSRWKSVQKALVKRDKWTKKSRGYGFVSFSDPDDFFQAAKEMNGKYIGSHPVVVRKSKTEIKLAPVKDDRKGGKKHGGGGGGDKNKNKVSGSSGHGGADGHNRRGYESGLGPVSSGVHKAGQKTKGGLKLLG